MTEKRSMFHRLLGRVVRSVSIVFLIVVVMLSSLVLLPQAKATQAAGLSYFVDAISGNDSNDGRSEGTAWKTIAKVNAVSFVPGDQILFKRGETWKETLAPLTSGIAGAPIVFGSYGTGVLPVLDGENARMNVVGSGRSYLTFQELDCRNGNPHGLHFDSADHITVQDCVVSGVSWYGINFYTGTFALVQHNTVSNSYSGVNFAKGTSYSRAHHNVVTNMTGSGVTAIGDSDHNEIDENDASVCGYAGFYLGGDYNTIHNNHFHHNWSATFPTSGEPYGIGISDSSYNEIYDNEINDNQYQGLEVYSDPSNISDGNKIYRNKIYNNAYNGISFVAYGVPSAANNEVYYNLIYDNAYSGLRVSSHGSSLGNKFYNNTVVGNYGIASHGAGLQGVENDGWTFKNNIFADNVGTAEEFECFEVTVIHDYNLYHRASGNLVNYNDVYYNATNVLNFEATALSVDPLFVDVVNHDYHLQPVSPAINAGTNVGQTTGFDGNPISGQPDLGAFETSQVAPTPIPVNPTLSGRLTKTDGSGLDGVTLSLSNSGGSVVTANGGLYSITVPSGWSGQVTPSFTNGNFAPSSRNYSNLTANQTSQDYGWTAPVNPTISGRVTQKNGTGLDGVVLNLSNGGGKVTTSGGGYYSITVPYGWSGKVTPSYATKGVFTPSSKTYSNVTTNKTSQNYSWSKK